MTSQDATERNCAECLWHYDGTCHVWECDFIDRKEAAVAYKMEQGRPDKI